MKNTLFRFATVRKPNRILQENKKNTITYPKSSGFYKAALTKKTQEEIEKVVLDFAGKFKKTNKFLKGSIILTKYKDLHALGGYLEENTKTLQNNKLKSYFKKFSGLKQSELAILWDNLFYRLVKDVSPDEREVILLILRTNALGVFTKKVSILVGRPLDTLQKQIIAKFNSVIILPERLVNKRSDTFFVNTSVSKRNEKLLQQEFDSAIKALELVQLKKALKEFNQAEKKFDNKINTDKKKFIDAQQKKQEIQLNTLGVKGLIAEEIRQSLQRTWNKFCFNPEDGLDKNFLNTKISSDSIAILDKYKTNQHTSIKAFKKTLEKQISQNENLFTERNVHQLKTVTINGINININNKLPKGTIAIRSVPVPNVPKEYTFYLFRYNDKLSRNNFTVQLEVEIKKETTRIVGELVTQKENNQIFLFRKNGLKINPKLIRISLILKDKLNFNAKIPLLNNLLFSTIPAALYTPPIPSIVASQEATQLRLFGVKQLEIAEFRRVEQELIRYEPGEVSHIENIVARAYRERSTRNLKLTENIVETTSEKGLENLRDTSSTDRFEMNMEVSAVLDEDRQRNFGVNAGASGDSAINWYVDGSATFGSSSSESISNTKAINTAREVTNKALEKVILKSTKKLISTAIKEFEEINKSGFDNKNSDNHVNGVFRWLNKRYKNTIVNYGKRLSCEFMIPEPARNFLYSLEEEDKSAITILTLSKPLSPSEFLRSNIWQFPNSSQFTSIVGFNVNDLNFRNKALRLAAYYGAEIEEAPTQEIIIGRSYAESGMGGSNINKSFAYNDFEIPQGYKCTSIETMYGHVYPNKDNKTTLTVFINGENFFLDTSTEGIEDWYTGSFSTDNQNFNQIEGFIPVSLRLTGTPEAFQLNVTAKCKILQEYENQWRLEAYNAIMGAYEKKLQTYYDSINGNEDIDEEREKIRNHPMKNRMIEQQELKRAAMELITKPFGFVMGKDNFDPDDSIQADGDFEKYTELIKFLENVFDWNLMYYQFYPYYWADKDKWHTLMNQSNESDILFDYFLQSGMAKLIVPVKRGFEVAVCHYLKSGQVWVTDNITTDEVDEYCLSLLKELENQDEEITLEDTWESVVPSSLTIVQDETWSLKDDGSQSNTNGLSVGNNKMAIGGNQP